MVAALVAEQNRRQLDLISTTYFHACQCETVTGGAGGVTITRTTVSAANASDLATSITLVNQIKSVYNKHVVDRAAHSTGTLSSQISTDDATNLATAQTLANAIKAAYNTHRTASSVHYNNDSTNAVSSADATDQTSLNTLLNEMKGDLNAHIASAPAGSFIRLVNA